MDYLLSSSPAFFPSLLATRVEDPSSSVGCLPGLQVLNFILMCIILVIEGYFPYSVKSWCGHYASSNFGLSYQWFYHHSSVQSHYYQRAGALSSLGLHVDRAFAQYSSLTHLDSVFPRFSCVSQGFVLCGFPALFFCVFPHSFIIIFLPQVLAFSSSLQEWWSTPWAAVSYSLKDGCT